MLFAYNKDGVHFKNIKNKRVVTVAIMRTDSEFGTIHTNLFVTEVTCQLSPQLGIFKYLRKSAGIHSMLVIPLAPKSIPVRNEAKLSEEFAQHRQW